jgi:hypothetical protein
MSHESEESRLDIEIKQGATFELSMEYTTGPTDEAQDPVDLTGCTARAHIRKTIASETPEIELTTENGRIALGGAAGTIELTIEADDTDALDFRTGMYDLELVFPTGQVKRLVWGKVVFVRGVTRDA